jgi:cytochrome c oxidase cbb3-type subunit 3
MQEGLTGPADDQVILGHKYDGIREYDNPMPGWWVALFVGSVLVMPFYGLGVHVFDWFDTYEENLAQAQAELAAQRDAYRARGGFDASPVALAEYAEDPTFVAAGQANFAVCAACHGQRGEGLIGPNLTDAYWIHGSSPADVYEMLEVGVPEKGMPAWDSQFSEEERAQITAFVLSLKNTDVPGGKAPEGELAP